MMRVVAAIAALVAAGAAAEDLRNLVVFVAGETSGDDAQPGREPTKPMQCAASWLALIDRGASCQGNGAATTR